MSNLTKKDNRGFIQVGTFLTPKQLKQLDEIATAYQVSRSVLIRLAIAKYVLKEYDLVTRKSSI